MFLDFLFIFFTFHSLWSFPFIPLYSTRRRNAISRRVSIRTSLCQSFFNLYSWMINCKMFTIKIKTVMIDILAYVYPFRVKFDNKFDFKFDIFAQFSLFYWILDFHMCFSFALYECSIIYLTMLEYHLILAIFNFSLFF